MIYNKISDFKVGDFLVKKTGDIWKVKESRLYSLGLTRVFENGVVKTPERKGSLIQGEFGKKITKEYALAQINTLSQIVNHIDLQEKCLHQMNEIAGLCCCEEICPCKINSCAAEISK